MEADNIFTAAPNEAQMQMLTVLDTVRRELIAGNLRGLVILGVHKSDNVLLDGILCGTSETISWQLQRAQFSLGAVDMAMRQQQYAVGFGQLNTATKN